MAVLIPYISVSVEYYRADTVPFQFVSARKAGQSSADYCDFHVKYLRIFLKISATRIPASRLQKSGRCTEKYSPGNILLFVQHNY